MISAMDFMVMKKERVELRKARIEADRKLKAAAEENKPKRIMQLLELYKWAEKTLNGRDIDGIEVRCELKSDPEYDWIICICQSVAKNTILSIKISDSGTFVFTYDSKSAFRSDCTLDDITKRICEILISFTADRNLLKYNYEG